MGFRLWSETSGEAKEMLSPEFEIRKIEDLNPGEREAFFHHVFQLIEADSLLWSSVASVIRALNEIHKARSYARNYLRNPDPAYAREDLKVLLQNGQQDVIFQVLTLFGKAWILHGERVTYVTKFEGMSDEEHAQQVADAAHKGFDEYADKVNDTLRQFGINYRLTRQGFSPVQDERIIGEVYDPVLRGISGEKWEAVNRDLADAFADYRLGTPQGYSGTITHAVSAVQGFLQIKLKGEPGKGDLSNLIKEGLANGKIPNDDLSTILLKGVESFLQKERKVSGDPHPKETYANEKNALLVLDLSMIFIKHCM